MEVVEIPTTVLFEEMLKKLGLPSPKYESRQSEEPKFISSVRFYPATRCLSFAYGPISLKGRVMDTMEAANNDAAEQAIKYMEKTEQKILKDYSYDQLNKEKLVEKSHINQIIENNKKTGGLIREKDQKIKEITRHWDKFIEDVSTTNNKVYQIAEEGYMIGAFELENDINATLWEVQKGTEHLSQLTFQSTDLLRQVGKYPYDTDSDSGEADQFPGYYPGPSLSPEHDMKNCLDDDIMYDSDDLSSMDYLHL